MKRIAFFLYLLIFFTLSLNAQKAELLVQTGHSGMIHALSISPDGKTLASFAGDKIIKLWDLNTGKTFLTINTENPSVSNIDFTSDGAAVVGIKGRDSIVLWSCDNGKALLSFGTEALYYTSSLSMHPTLSQLAYVGLGIAVRDLKTGNILWKKQEQSLTQAVCYSPDGKYIAIAGLQEEIRILDSQTGALVRSIPIGASERNPNRQLQFSQNYILTNSDKQIVLYRLTDGKKIQSIEMDMAFSAAISTDEKYILANGLIKNLPVIRLINIETGVILNERQGAFGKISTSPKHPIAAMAVWDLSGPSILVFDIRTAQQTHHLKGSFYMAEGLAITNQHQIVTAGMTGIYNNPVRVWDLKMGALDGFKTKRYAAPLAMELAQDSILALAESDSTLRLYALSSGKLLHQYRHPNTWIYALRALNENQFAIGSFDGTVSIWRPTQKPKTLGKHEYMISDLYHDNQFLYSAAVDGIKKWSLESGTQASCELTAIGHPYFAAKNNTAFFIGDHRYVSVSDRPDFHFSAAVLPPNPVLSMAYRSRSKTLAVGYHDGRISIFNTESGDSLHTLIGHSLAVSGLKCTQDERYFASAGHDSKVILWDGETGKEVATFIALDTANYIITTPDHYYKATKPGLAALAFRYQGKIFPFEQFDLPFNRPDIVLERIGYADTALIQSYKRAYEKRLKKMGLNENQFNGDFHLPEITLAGLALPPTSETKTIKVELQAKDSKYKLDRIQLYVNGVPVYGLKGVSLKEKNVQEYRHTEQLILSNGNNTITYSVLNEKGIESFTGTHQIRYVGEPTSRNLYLICIGTSHFADQTMNLNYAAKDAEDIKRLFYSDTTGFAKVHHKMLLNSDCTLENIQQLRSWLSTSNPDDRVVVFVASHGVLDDSLDYFIATYDMDFREPEHKGLAYEQLEQLMDGIPAREKLIFIDACHSGEIDKESVQLLKQAQPGAQMDEFIAFRSFPGTSVQQVGLENSFELMKELFRDIRKSSGAVVLSSAGGAEYAIESAEVKNGLFTSCLIEGIEKGKADINGDGAIYLSELQVYLQEAVFVKSGGRQRPTSRIENISADFRIR
jgi:WD40 repeat protein